jgi:hypothetical protein
MVRMRGLEPPSLTALVPKTSVSTIPPHPRVVTYALVYEIRRQKARVASP